MPRAPRKVSSTGIYHIMIRGINQSPIFTDEVDRSKFLDIVKETKAETKFELYAYCLMGNHAHFLIKENETSISVAMQKICGTYGGWFNYRHHRVGHLFQNRFRSECVETESYFITVLKYILNNPVKSNLVGEAKEYKWSSFNEYIRNNSITDIEFFLNMLDDNLEKAKKSFIKELKKEESEEDIVNLTADNIKRTDAEAEVIINEEMKKLGVENIEQLPAEQRILILRKYMAKGVTKRQIMDITGLPRRILNKT